MLDPNWAKQSRAKQSHTGQNVARQGKIVLGMVTVLRMVTILVVLTFLEKVTALWITILGLVTILVIVTTVRVGDHHKGW